MGQIRQTRKALRRSPIRPMPLVVIAHGHPDLDTPFVELEEPFRRQLQRELAHLIPGGRLVMATERGHDIHHEQPELVLDAIRDVVLAVRAGDLVPTDERVRLHSLTGQDTGAPTSTMAGRGWVSCPFSITRSATNDVPNNPTILTLPSGRIVC